MSTVRTQQLFSIQNFVTRLRQVPEADFLDVAPIQRFLHAHPVAPDTLEPYLTWDPQHYTRNLIDKTPLYELIAICWEVGQGSSVHNHRDQNCWMAVPIGRLLVGNYHLVSQDIEHGSCQLEVSDTIEMNPANPCAVNPQDPVHRVYNPREFGQRAVSLHVYSRPFDTCEVYSMEKGTCGDVPLRYTSVKGVMVE